MKSKFYMNTETGIVKTYDGWFYKKGSELVNAVDLGEVVPAVWCSSGSFYALPYFNSKPDAPGERFYMSPFTGSVDSQDGWEYEDEDGNILDGVERGEALEVEWDEDAQEWGEIDWGRDLWKAYMTDQGCWIAEGNFLGQFIIVEGTTRKEAIKGWQDVATKKANKKAKSYDIN